MQANTPVAHTEPLKVSVLPEARWHSVSADSYGPLPTGEYLFEIVDDYIRYPVVESVKSTSANTVIPVKDKVFSMFGIPRAVKTENGPSFNSDQFFPIYRLFRFPSSLNHTTMAPSQCYS